LAKILDLNDRKVKTPADINDEFIGMLWGGVTTLNEQLLVVPSGNLKVTNIVSIFFFDFL
jgi:hypothetical protein